ncbi:MAG: beta-aspartyl-peptidase [Chloroflexi bacterium]|nr:beta-aspartyl-peptidase [Chloroflexota bacterium]
MRLEWGTFLVKDAVFGHKTQLSDGVLSIDRDGLRSFLAQDPNLGAIDVEIVHPGDETRIVHALDVVEPRFKVAGHGSTFPGLLGPPHTVGEGRTHRLRGVTVVQTADIPHRLRPTQWDEAIIDMSGPGVEYSPFGKTVNVVVGLRPVSGLTPEEYDTSLLLGGLRAAEYLAKSTADLQPEQVETFELGPVTPGLPKVAYIRVASGTNDVAIYGAKSEAMTPTLIHPNEILDGAVVNLNWGFASERNVTYVQLNNPEVLALYRHHGKDLNFVGVVMSGSGARSQWEKDRNAEHLSKLARLLGAEAAIISWDWGGSSQFDLMLTCQKCEKLGIKTVLVVVEMDQSLIFSTPEADAIVSPGITDEVVELPEMKRVIGGETLYKTGWEAKGRLEVPVRYLMASTNRLGFHCLTARQS